MGHAKPGTRRWILSVRTALLSLLSVLVTVLLILFIALAVRRTGDGVTAPDAGAPVSVPMTGGAGRGEAAAGNSAGPMESADEETGTPGGVSQEDPETVDASSPAPERPTEVDLRAIGAPESAPVVLADLAGSIMEPPDARLDTRFPRALHNGEPVRLLYRASGADDFPGAEEDPVVALARYIASGVPTPGIVSAVERSPYLREVISRFRSESAPIEIIYLAGAGTDVTTLLARDERRMWWTVWAYLAGGELFDLEYAVNPERE